MRTTRKITFANAAVLVLLFSSFFSVKANHQSSPQKPTLSVAKDISLQKANKTFDFEDDSFETELEDDALPLLSIQWLSLYNSRVTDAPLTDASPTRLFNSIFLLVTRSLRI